MRVVVVLACGLGLFWIVLSATIAQVFSQSSPETALAWRPGHAEAEAAEAERVIQGQRNRSAVAHAESLARAALMREPVSASAARTLGLVVALHGDQSRAFRLFNYSEALSRRDLATQLWLIEAEVGRNNIAGALHHYDRAMRTSLTARQVLVPILVQASSDPAIAGPLAALLAQRPNWWLAAVGPILRGDPDPATLPLFTEGLRLDPAARIDRGLLNGALHRLVNEGEFGGVFEVYRRATGRDGRSLENGEFTRGPGLVPVDWELRDEPELSAQIRRRNGARAGDTALFLTAGNGRGGRVATQLLGLAPGRYRLEGLVGDVEGDLLSRPQLRIGCAGGRKALLGAERFPQAGSSGQRIGLDFEVPHDCDAQWLVVRLLAGLQPQAVTPWIDNLGLTRR